MNLLEEVTELLMLQIKDLPRTAYSLNKKTGINLSTCNQIINGTWNPLFNTLLQMKEKYEKRD